MATENVPNGAQAPSDAVFSQPQASIASPAEELRQWMCSPANLHAREAILMHRLSFDIQLAAARRGYYLNTYYDDVDHDGFDLIFDDQDTVKKTQVKTVEAQAATGQWEIHKRILRPSFEHLDKLGFESSPEGEGVEGGFLLMQFDTAVPGIGVKYFYTDLYVRLAFECDVIRRRHAARQTAVEDCLSALQRGLGHERVVVPWAMMLQATGPDELLALSGLHGRADFWWKHHVFLIANHVRPQAHPEMLLPRPLPELKRMTADAIRALVVDSDLIDGDP
jgi:hypothetical protein